jgi:hypothetical protein
MITRERPRRLRLPRHLAPTSHRPALRTHCALWTPHFGLRTPDSGLRTSDSALAATPSIVWAEPQIGRVFTGPGDGIVISDGLWRRQFGADRAIVGKNVVVSRDSTTIVGVMPATLSSRTRRCSRAL